MSIKYITTDQMLTYLQERQYDLVENYGLSRAGLSADDKIRYDTYEKIIKDLKRMCNETLA